MVLAAGDRILIYTSKNLKQWTYASEFGQGQGSHGGVWECPDLFELPVDGNPKQKKWVMQVSVGNGAVSGGSGMQYFVGSFDGTTFKNENPQTKYYGPTTVKTFMQLFLGLIHHLQTDGGFG